MNKLFNRPEIFTVSPNPYTSLSVDNEIRTSSFTSSLTSKVALAFSSPYSASIL